MSPRAWLAALGAGLLLRVVGIRWGWPATFNADEPFLVNLALSFGGGSLRPYLFKYPTLWPYLLFAAYGAYFLAWSGLGLRRSIEDFVSLYAWHPGSFFLIGRLLAAACSLAAAEALRRAERDLGRPRPWAGLMLLASPLVVELAHSCKPDCAMLLLACLGWRAALEVQRAGGRRAHWACGACFGLALSAQYTALPGIAVLPLAHALARGPAPRLWLLEGLGACAAAFVLGSPYALLDFPRLRESLRDIVEFDRLLGGGSARAVLANLWTLGGPGPLAGAAALAGLVRLARRRSRLAPLLALPVLLNAALLARSPEGGWARYLLVSFPALALLAGEGVEWLGSRRARAAWALGAALLLPWAAASARTAWRMSLPDTRQEASAWLRANVPEGEAVLLDEEHASPRLPMDKEQALELAVRLRAAGSPRARIYQAMADSAGHAGGWRVYRVLRSARDLHAYPRHVLLSQADSPVVDVSKGIASVRSRGIGWAVTSSFGLEEGAYPGLAREARLEKEFRPEPGAIEGPLLRVYRLR